MEELWNWFQRSWVQIQLNSQNIFIIGKGFHSDCSSKGAVPEGSKALHLREKKKPKPKDPRFVPKPGQPSKNALQKFVVHELYD